MDDKTKKGAACTCAQPIADVMWPEWDGTCRRCGMECGDRVLTDVSACSAEVGDDEERGPWRGFNVRDGYPERRDGDEMLGVRGGQGRTAAGMVNDVRGFVCLLGLVLVSLGLWALLAWAGGLL